MIIVVYDHFSSFAQGNHKPSARKIIRNIPEASEERLRHYDRAFAYR